MDSKTVKNFALALSIGALGSGIAACASQKAQASPADQQAQAMKGGEKSCGKSSCGKDQKTEQETAATEKGADKGCGKGSCS